MQLPRLTTTLSLQLFQLLRFGSFFLTGILLIKAGTAPETIGHFEKLMFLSGLASFFWVQGMVTRLLNSYHHHSDRRVYIFNVFLLISIFSFIVFAILKAGSVSIQNYFSSGTLPGYNYICLYIVFNAPSYLIETIYLLNERPKPLLVYGAVNSIMTIFTVALPAWYGYSLESSIALLALWSCIRYLWLLRVLLKNSVIQVRYEFLREHVVYSLPFILTFIIAGSADYIDGLLVNHYFSANSFAVYRYGARELPLSLLLANALGTSMIPLISKNSGEGILQLKNETGKIMSIIFPVTMLLMVVSPWLYTVFFSSGYLASAAIFNIYLLLAVSRTLFPQTILQSLHFSSILLKVSILEIVINFTCSLLLMKYWGLAGIAAGTVIANYFEKGLLTLIVWKKLKINPKTYVSLSWLIFSFFTLLVYFFTLLFRHV